MLMNTLGNSAFLEGLRVRIIILTLHFHGTDEFSGNHTKTCMHA
jgi:hypothetical protein